MSVHPFLSFDVLKRRAALAEALRPYPLTDLDDYWFRRGAYCRCGFSSVADDDDAAALRAHRAWLKVFHDGADLAPALIDGRPRFYQRIADVAFAAIAGPAGDVPSAIGGAL